MDTDKEGNGRGNASPSGNVLICVNLCHLWFKISAGADRDNEEFEPQISQMDTDKERNGRGNASPSGNVLICVNLCHLWFKIWRWELTVTMRSLNHRFHRWTQIKKGMGGAMPAHPAMLLSV